MKNSTNNAGELGFFKTVALVIAGIVAVIAIVWFSIITTSAVIKLVAIGFVAFLVFEAYDLIKSNIVKIVVIAIILAVAYQLRSFIQ